MAAVESPKQGLARLWKWWQEADAVRGLLEFIVQAGGFVVRWGPVALTIGFFLGALVLGLIANAIAYILYLPALGMFIVGVFFSVRLLRRQTIPAPIDQDTMNAAMPEEDATDDTTESLEERPTTPSRLRVEHFIQRFDVAWQVVRVPMQYSILALNNIFERPRDKMRALGPYCPDDHTLLKYKDSGGVRSLMDDDDVGLRGTMHCPACDKGYDSEKGYLGSITVEMYRHQLERELNG